MEWGWNADAETFYATAKVGQKGNPTRNFLRDRAYPFSKSAVVVVVVVKPVEWSGAAAKLGRKKRINPIQLRVKTALSLAAHPPKKSESLLSCETPSLRGFQGSIG